MSEKLLLRPWLWLWAWRSWYSVKPEWPESSQSASFTMVMFISVEMMNPAPDPCAEEKIPWWRRSITIARKGGSSGYGTTRYATCIASSGHCCLTFLHADGLDPNAIIIRARTHHHIHSFFFIAPMDLICFDFISSFIKLMPCQWGY